MNDEKCKEVMEKAEAANKVKSEFLANMSHEILTPLNGVIGFTELLLNTRLNKQQQQYADHVLNSGYNLLEIINDILDYSKIEAGKLELDPVRVDIIDLVEHAADIVKVNASKKGLEFLLNLAPDLPRYAVVDPMRLNQILINLLNNAQKFTSNGEIELKLNCTKIDIAHARLDFSVRDTGIGINETQKGKLFQAFSQLDSSFTRKHGGTGLGLVISNHLAHMMGSKIELESELDKGSRFFFSIETKVEYSPKMEQGDLSDIKRILVVDDNYHNRLILVDTFKYWGIQADNSDNGVKALKMIRENDPYDLIIVDYHMPYMDGLDTIRMIREHLSSVNEHVPIILLHSSAEDAMFREECQRLGITLRLTKPVKKDELLYYLLKINAKQQDIIYNVQPTQTDAIEPQTNNAKPVILIAEDNELNLILVKEMILKAIPEATIYEAHNGLAAVKAVQDYKPQIVMMDIQMPLLDGINATKRIRVFSNIPIIALTAGTVKEDKIKCFDAGMNDYISKPFVAKDLHDALTKYLGTKTTGLDSGDTSAESKQLYLHFNMNALLDNLSQDRKSMLNLFPIARKSIPKTIASLEKAFAESNLGDIKAVLHSMRGSAQNMYFIKLADLTRYLENNFQNLTSLEIDKYLNEIEAEWIILEEILDDLSSEES